MRAQPDGQSPLRNSLFPVKVKEVTVAASRKRTISAQWVSTSCWNHPSLRRSRLGKRKTRPRATVSNLTREQRSTPLRIPHASLLPTGPRTILEDTRTCPHLSTRHYHSVAPTRREGKGRRSANQGKSLRPTHQRVPGNGKCSDVNALPRRRLRNLAAKGATGTLRRRQNGPRGERRNIEILGGGSSGSGTTTPWADPSSRTRFLHLVGHASTPVETGLAFVVRRRATNRDSGTANTIMAPEGLPHFWSPEKPKSGPYCARLTDEALIGCLCVQQVRQPPWPYPEWRLTGGDMEMDCTWHGVSVSSAKPGPMPPTLR